MFRMDKAKGGGRSGKLSELVKLRNNLEAELYADTLINEKITENLQHIQCQRHEEKKELSALAKRIKGMEKCQQYSGYRKFGLITEMKRKKRMIKQFQNIQGKLFDPSKKASELESFNQQFSKQLQEAPWLPEKRAILGELKKQQEELGKIQNEVAVTDEMIAERSALLAQHKETPFKTFCLALANYSFKAHAFIKAKDKEFENAAKLEAKMENLLKDRTAETPMQEDRFIETSMSEDRNAEIPMPEDRNAETPMPEDRTAKKPPESINAAKHVRFEIISSPDSQSTASYQPYTMHKRQIQQQKESDMSVSVSNNDGFGGLFTTPTAPGSGHGQEKQQQQQINSKKVIVDTSKNVATDRLSASFSDMNSEFQGGGYLDNLFTKPPAPGGNRGPTKEQQQMDMNVSKDDDGFGSLFTAPIAPGGSRGPTKELQQQINPKKAIVDTSKNVNDRFSSSFLDMNPEQDVTLSKDNGFLNKLFGPSAGDGNAGPSKEQSFQFGGFGGFNFDSNENASGTDNNDFNFAFKF